MATIKIHGKEYPVPEEFTMGELADMEDITGQGYDMSQRGIKGMIAIAYISARRVDPSVTVDDIRRLNIEQISSAGDEDEEELTADPPTVSDENASGSVEPSGNGSGTTPDVTRDSIGTPA